MLELRDGDRVLEIGVGTGLSLPLIPAGCRMTGVDFSRPMLEKALPRVRDGALACEAALVEADGTRLPFADGTFDAFIVAFKIPNFMRRLFAEGAFSQAFVPVDHAGQNRFNFLQVEFFVQFNGPG